MQNDCKNRKLRTIDRGKHGKFLFPFFLLFLLFTVDTSGEKQTGEEIRTGADQPEQYLPVIRDKAVTLVVNQTSRVGNIHLIDFLKQNGIEIRRILAPEHGYRGEAEAGAAISDHVDPQTGIPVISLYGEKKKPTKEDLSGTGIVIFDIQDVGCRFFTYLSTLHNVMETCAETGIPLMVLDRPNPNGDYVDGPVMIDSLKSFVGMHPVPVVHGCTLGEMARMINGEGWLKSGLKCSLQVIPVKGYKHADQYDLPVKPSPNLPNRRAVRLYPSLCFFEATNVSIGRGTNFPFQVLGYPDASFGKFLFMPRPVEGVSVNPLHQGKTCYGDDLRELDEIPRFTLAFFIRYAKRFPSPDAFWSSERWIGLLSGDPQFYKQVNSGMGEEEIRATWQPALENYKSVRKKYLLYPDFE